MRVLVTRPQPEADRTAAALRTRGHEPLLDSLLEVRPVPGPPLDLRGVQALLVTSPNGVRAAAARTAVRDLPLYAVGSRTAALATEAGFSQVHDAGGAAADLAAAVALAADPAAGRLLHVSGAEQAVDLAHLLGPRGYRVTRLVAYEAVPVAALRPGTLAALADGSLAYVSFFSPRTARTFASLIESSGYAADCRQATALCLSPAVARAVEGPLWQAVVVAARPDAESLLALLPPGTPGR